MKGLQGNRSWLLLALLVSVSVVGAAVTLAQQDAAEQQPTARDARQLSSVFTKVAQRALPSIVSIETRGKAVQVPEGGLPFGEDSPFRKFFEDQPEFRKFFEQMPERRMPRRRGMGSGFIIDESGVIMTNSHVVSNAEEVTVRLHDGREFVASDIKTDPRSDVAIVQIDASGLQPIRLGNSDQIRVGDWVLAIGSPFGLDMSVTAGIISAKGRGPGINVRENYLQTDAAINPGNSGGPLLNLNGEVVGISTAISSRSGGYQGIGFAIPVNMAKWVSGQLIEQGEVRRAYLGVGIQPVTSELAKKFETPVGQGAIVSQVMPDSPADDAGLQTGDVLLKLNGKQIKGPRQLQGLVEQLSIGESYDLTLLRNGERQTVPITVREMPKKFGMSSRPTPEREPEKEEEQFKDIGLEIQKLTPEIAKKLGIEEGIHGVVVTAVEPGSPAQEAGLEGGIVIQNVDNQPVNSPEEFRAAMKDASLQEGILLLVRSGDRTQFVVVEK